MEVDLWIWATFIAFILGMLAIDLFVFHRDVEKARTKVAGGA